MDKYRMFYLCLELMPLELSVFYSYMVMQTLPSSCLIGFDTFR